MHLPKPSNTQVVSPLGTFVVEDHDKGIDRPKRFDVPEPLAGETQPPADQDPPKAA